MNQRINEIIKKIEKKHFNEIKTRDPKRINRILGKLATIWNNSYDLRFGQLITYLRNGKIDDPFYIEDDKWEIMCDVILDQNKLVNKYVVVKKSDLLQLEKYIEDVNTHSAAELLEEILE